MIKYNQNYTGSDKNGVSKVRGQDEADAGRVVEELNEEKNA